MKPRQPECFASVFAEALAESFAEMAVRIAARDWYRRQHKIFLPEVRRGFLVLGGTKPHLASWVGGRS